MTPLNTQHAPHLAFLEAQVVLSGPATLALHVAVTFEKWSIRQRTRRALNQLEPHLLRDIGLDRRTALTEARRKFWQG